MNQLTTTFSSLYPNATITGVEEDRMRIYFKLQDSSSEYHMQVELPFKRIAIYRKCKQTNIWIAINNISFHQFHSLEVTTCLH